MSPLTSVLFKFTLSFGEKNMKKLSLAVSLAALMAASPALAQNDSMIDQIDVNNSMATVTQSTVGGNTNDSVIRQEENSLGQGNNLTAIVNQGKVLPGVIGTAEGNENTSRIRQAGRNAEATVSQGGLNNGGADGSNYSEIAQRGIGGPNSTNFANVIQRGARNTNISQVGDVDDTNGTFISHGQNGEDLTLKVEQSGNDNANTSGIRQFGNGNRNLGDPENIDVSQSGSDNFNDSQIDQDGFSLEAKVIQDGTALVNDSTIDQKGNSSTISVTQNGSGNGSSDFNISDIVQDATGSEIIVEQGGDGNENTSNITQLGADLSLVDVSQSGTNNVNNSTVNQSNGTNMQAYVIQN
jgi:hypothetical protein